MQSIIHLYRSDLMLISQKERKKPKVGLRFKNVLTFSLLIVVHKTCINIKYELTTPPSFLYEHFAIFSPAGHAQYLFLASDAVRHCSYNDCSLLVLRLILTFSVHIYMMGGQGREYMVYHMIV